jgi:hypothetical protein
VDDGEALGVAVALGEGVGVGDGRRYFTSFVPPPARYSKVSSAA